MGADPGAREELALPSPDRRSPTTTRHWRRRLSNGVIAVVLAVMAIDALPWVHELHGDLKDRIDPALDVTGTWQGTWDLFAPWPDSLNERFLATVELADGTTREWSSPDWRSQNVLQRFLSFRELEFYDDLAEGGGPPIYSRLADHIVAAVTEPGEAASVRRVVIERATAVVTDPTVEFVPLDGYLELDDRVVVHVESYG